LLGEPFGLPPLRLPFSKGLAADCRFDLHGTSADGQSMDAPGINVCADKTLNLTD